VRSRLSGDAERFVRRCHPWLSRWLAVRWWLAALVAAAAVAWFSIAR
jgi:hypothetical protein